MKYLVEYTDTFGREANYSWVNRITIESASEKTSVLMRKAKKALGLSGLRGRTNDMGDLVEFRPYRLATVLFITPTWEPENEAA